MHVAIDAAMHVAIDEAMQVVIDAAKPSPVFRPHSWKNLRQAYKTIASLNQFYTIARVFWRDSVTGSFVEMSGRQDGSPTRTRLDRRQAARGNMRDRISKR